MNLFNKSDDELRDFGQKCNDRFKPNNLKR
jgi:hypothetical protein